jgi:hypothetical protein
LDHQFDSQTIVSSIDAEINCDFEMNDEYHSSSGSKTGRMEGWKDGRMEGWKNGRLEEWMI